MPFDSSKQSDKYRELAKEAKAKKSEMWNHGGAYLTQVYLDQLIELSEKKPEEFREKFAPVLNYFKPRLTSTDVTSKGEQVNMGVVVLPAEK